MAGNVAEFKLNWFDRDKREFKHRTIQIFFCSMYIDREYPPLLHRAASILAYTRRIAEIKEQIAQARKDRPDGYKEIISRLTEEVDKLTAGIEEFAAVGTENELLKKRHALVEELLLSNGVTDPEILSFDFWDRCVSGTAAWDLLELATNKDRKPGREKKK